MANRVKKAEASIEAEEYRHPGGMRVTSVNLPRAFHRAMLSLCKRGLYKDRSEFIRAAIREKLQREQKDILFEIAVAIREDEK